MVAVATWLPPEQNDGRAGHDAGGVANGARQRELLRQALGRGKDERDREEACGRTGQSCHSNSRQRVVKRWSGF